jgi:putative peptidoglycan lipid II flippase
MAAFALSSLMGLARQIIVSRTFGTQADIDAYNAASTYPDLIFSLIAGGALASAFIPTITDFLTKGERRSAWYLTSAIANLVTLVLTATSLLSMLFAPWIVANILAPKFDPALQELTTDLLRILLLAPTLFGLSGLIMGLLNAHQIFLAPALAPAMYPLGMIIGVLLLSPQIGIYGLAWGAVLGALLHLCIQIPALLRLPDRHYFRSLGLDFPAVHEVWRLMAPRLLGVGAVQINFVVNTILATGQPEGSLTAIKYAWAIMAMPQVVIAQAIAIAALPTFSAQASRGETVNLRLALANTLRGILLLSLPASLALMILRVPIIQMLFQRGEFDAHSTEIVAWALLWYATGLVGHSVVEIVSRAFYALHDTLTPVVASVAAMSLNVALSISLSSLFENWGLPPHGGLALANSLATTLEMFALLILMRRRLNGIHGKQLLATGLQTALAGLMMSAGLWMWVALTEELPVWFVVAGSLILGTVLFAGSALLLRIPEAQTTASLLVKRITRRGI